MAAGDAAVNIVFTADTSQMTAAFAQVNSELSSVSSGSATASMAAWRKETGLTEQATIGANRTMGTFGGTIGKTAANFKPATAEMRAASIATEELSEKSSVAGGSLSQLAVQAGVLYAAWRLLHEAGDAIKYVVTQSAALETADVRFKNLAGNTIEATTAFEGLKIVAKETNTNILELAPAANTVLEAGVPMNKLDEAMRHVADRARVAGSSVGEMADIVLRANTRGEVSGRQLAMIEKVTGDEAGKLSAEYKNMSIGIPEAVKQMELLARATDRAREDSDKMLSAQNAFAEKHGAKEIGAAFQRQGGEGSAPSVNISGMGGLAGAGQQMVSKAWSQLQSGMTQIAKEEGYSTSDVSSMVRSGEIDYSELMGASQRARTDKTTKEKRDYEDKRTALDQEKERERLDLAAKATTGIIGPEGAGVKGQVARVAATQEDLVKKASLQLTDASQNAGTALQRLSHWIDDLTKSATGYDVAAHPVKGAQAEPAYTPSGKPGGPGFDWSTYKPPASDKGGTPSGKDPVVAAIKSLTDLMRTVFGTP